MHTRTNKHTHYHRLVQVSVDPDLMNDLYLLGIPMYTHTHTRTHAHTQATANPDLYLPQQLCAMVHTRSSTYANKHIHTRAHVHTHTHTYTHTQATANPDLMDDLYLLGNRVVTYSPRLFLDNSVLSSVPAAQNSTAAGAAGGWYEGVQTSLLGALYPCLCFPALRHTSIYAVLLSSVPAAQNSTAAGAAGGRYEGVQTSLLGASYPCLPAFQGTQTFLQSCIFIRTLSCIVSHTGMRRYC